MPVLEGSGDGGARELHLVAARVDLALGGVVRDDALLRLTPLELRLLRFLVAQRGAPVSRSAVEREVWGYGTGVESHTVLSTIHRLRQKIERDPKAPDHLVTDRGHGYRLVLPEVVLVGPRLIPGMLHGRAGIVEGILAGLEGQPLVTLVGPGGVGKTRVAQTVAHCLTPARQVFWCDCADARSLPDLIQVLAAVLGVPLFGSDPLLPISHALGSFSRPLVVLDNLEQVLAGARQLVEALAALRSASLLATSRDALDLPCEAAVRLSPLPLEDATRLFMEQYRRVSEHASQPLSASQRDDVETIVMACGGLPLALELAAARARVMPLSELRRRLDAGRDEPLYASVEANIRRSWATLSASARTMLGRLAAFPAGASFEAAEACAPASADGEAIEVLDELVRKSLVSVDAKHADEMRFVIAEPVRGFALAEAVSERPQHHAACWLVTAAQRWAGLIEGSAADIAEGMKHLRREAPNLRAATRYLLAHGLPLAAPLACAQLHLWLAFGPGEEAVALVSEAIAIASSAPLHLVKARLLLVLGRAEEAMAALHDCIGAAPSVSVEADAQNLLAVIADILGQHDTADHARARAIVLYSADRVLGEAEIDSSRAYGAWGRGDAVAGVAHAERAVAGFDRAGAIYRGTPVRAILGACLLDTGQHERARLMLERTRDDSELAYPGTTWLSCRAFLALLQDDLGAADAGLIYGQLRAASRLRGQLVFTAFSDVYEASLPGDEAYRRALLEEAIRLGDKTKRPDVQALAAATYALFDPSRDDLRIRACELEPRLGMRRPAVRCLLGLAYDPEAAARSVALRLAQRTVSRPELRFLAQGG